VESRPIRLGDVIDDYCPRCRLLLNHDVASLNGAEVAKVTCRTCYNTHDYRRAEVPPKRSRKTAETKKLFEQVLAGMPAPAQAPPAEEPPPPPPAKKKRDLWADLERIRKK
jgi:hypothetical protein